MSVSRKDPFRNFRFKVEIDGIQLSDLDEVVMPSGTIDTIEYRDGNEAPTFRKIPGLIKYSNIVLKRGITESLELYNWYKTIEDGKINSSRKHVMITLLDELGTEIATWIFENAWPVKYTGPSLRAEGNEIAMETLEITYERMQRSK